MQTKILFSDPSLATILKANLTKKYQCYIKEVSMDSNMVRIVCFTKEDTFRLEKSLAKDYIKTSHFADDLLGIPSESRLNFMHLLLKNDTSYQAEEVTKASSKLQNTSKYSLF